MLHPGKEVRYDKDFRVNLRSEASGLGVDVEEIEANFFAACLLMPRRFLEADPEAAIVDVEDVEAVKSIGRPLVASARTQWSIRLGNLAPRRG